MRLVDAAAYFDRTVCTDAYTLGSPFNGQLNVFDDSARDGTTVLRRVLSVADGTPIPARRAIQAHGQFYIIGADHIDSFNGAVIRRKYVCHRADGLAVAASADQALRALAGTSMYAGRVWVKDMKELETSSRLSAFMSIFVASTETVGVGDFVSLSGRWHLVRNVFLGAAGFLTLESDQLAADCLGTAAYSARAGNVYDAVNDVIDGATATVPVMVHRWQDDFFYRLMTSAKFEVGDVVARVSKTNVPTALAGDTFVFAGDHYNVVSVRDDGRGAWTLHARRG
jgi:hypothetical protein